MKICSMSAFDLTIKVYDALSLDMIDKILLKDLPICVDIAQDFSNPEPYLVISTVNNLFVHLFGISLEMKPMDIHASKVIIVKYNFKYQSCISIDDSGIIEYWDINTGELPTGLDFEYKVQTDLYSLAKAREIPISLTISPNHEYFCIYTNNRNFQIFEFKTGKLLNTINESLDQYSDQQNTPNSEFRLERIEFHRRLALEKEIEKAKEKILPC